MTRLEQLLAAVLTLCLGACADRDARGPGGVVSGPAYLIGAGDPMLSTRAYSRRSLDGLGTSLDDLARNVREQGVKRIMGGIVVDETLFDRRRLGRWGTSAEVAPAVLFLAGLGARCITGQTLPVDGGYSIV